MEKQGWIERHPDPADRRSKRVALTQAALALAAWMETEVERLRSDFLEDADAAEVAAATRLLARLRERGLQLVAGDSGPSSG